MAAPKKTGSQAFSSSIVFGSDPTPTKKKDKQAAQLEAVNAATAAAPAATKDPNAAQPPVKYANTKGKRDLRFGSSDPSLFGNG
mmetsp:Transcript_31224/g.90743  ORF Transcript_31224/g.90743 Transcript_31224/m.90743 type:complete len:84 (+) Transcript_31224:132-383(+)|eukprot:CAMPEP_0118961318 /NCGR_PEP_ID=MMETSP1173-20130426/13_1 /TAXON_ID=1034831 /ORGANISM="Rhizochromulina marina cf, Strain CCMP1243" /LENGTH=83 /DNA_ID=CAMNT_0006909473 /DNA_START=139 /DNA_END=390 /DNA_ORIENTATION=-